MQQERLSNPLDHAGITPPRGRQGHSVPTARPLGLEAPLSSAFSSKGLSSSANQPLFPKLDSWPTTDLQHSGSSSSSSPTAMSPAQFYTHRDHVFGGSLSKLDRMRSHQESLLMEVFDEAEEYDDTDFAEEIQSKSTCSPVKQLPDQQIASRKTSTGIGSRGKNMSLDKLTGDSLLFFSYSAASGGSGLTPDSQFGGSFVQAFTQGLNSSLSIPYIATSPSPVGGAGSGEQFSLFPTAARNPNKAIITIDAQGSRILVANEMTCELFGYQPSELAGMKIQSLFTEPYRGKQRALMEQNISALGETIHISGKVMDAVTSYGIEFPVSVWMRRVGGDSKTVDSTAPRPQAPSTPRVIVVIEPVERSSALFSIDSDHMIASCDPWFACLFGFQDSSEVIGKRVTELIPSLTLPHATGEEVITEVSSKQAVTGRAKDGTVFPLTIKFSDISQSLSLSDLYSPTHTAQQPSTPAPSPVDSSNSRSPSQVPAQPPSSTDHTPSTTDQASSSGDHTPSTTDQASSSGDHTPSSEDHASSLGDHTPSSSPPSSALSPAQASASHTPSSASHAPSSGPTPPHASPGYTLSSTDHTPPSSSSAGPTPLSISPSSSGHTPSSTDPTPPSMSPSTNPTPSSALSSSTDPSPSLHSTSDSSPSTLPGSINAKAIVYAALSGMISFFLDGTIHGCNHHFAHMLFGYTQQELLKKDITFLLPDFYHHIGYVDDRSMPFPPVDDEDLQFHSVAERSLSPDKASDLLRSYQDRLRSPRHQQQLLSPTKRRPSPLQFPDLGGVGHSELSADSKEPVGQGTGNSEGSATPSPVQENAIFMQPVDPSDESDQVSSSGDMSCGSGIPSVPCIALNKPADLPPIPNRLVPSKSTERILDILNQRDSEMRSEGQKESLLSSTPAEKSGGNVAPHDESMNSQLGHSREMDQVSLGSQMSIQEGTFLGEARHKDGSLMAVVFQLKRITLVDGRDICCMWLSRDLDMERARTADLSMSMSRPLHDPYGQHHLVVSPDVDIDLPVEGIDGGIPRFNASGHALWPHAQQQQQAEEVVAMEGEYSSSYSTLRPMGKGAFGFVRLAQKIEDDSLVVVKFLRKSSVLKDCWISDKEMGVVPLEIALLARLCHDNIVQLLEAYENEHFFQMVMEKHGEGLDLFEFIERGPRLTEQHISYIFRQMVSALDYLHGQSIVHRDIKDENIIINQHFHIKLIDFGSAAHMAPDKHFNTFCGTLEYCSPEVLLGNSYAGPQLEMWAVGVTLYTLVFGENPFFDVEETISGHLQPPFLTSPALMKVLFWLLHPDPRSRATIKDLKKDKWTNQSVDESLLNFDTVLGHVSDCPASGGSVPTQMNGANDGPIKSNSEGRAIQLSRSMMEQLVVSEKQRKEGGAWC